MKKLLLLIILLSPLVSSGQQIKYAKNDFDFVIYLLGNSMRDEAVVLMDNTDINSYNDIATRDSMAFLKGFTYYNAQMLDKACYNLESISYNNPLFNRAMFFASLSNAHLGNFDKSENNLKEIISEDTLINNLKNFELSGIALLKRDLKAFDYYMSKTDRQDFRINSESERLIQLSDEIRSYKNKSVWLAGGLSALIPGLGKLYTGNLGEGISSFLLNASFITLSAENIHKKGLTNWKSIVFTSLSAVFYISNIYGSCISVKANYDIFNKKQNVQILYSIHIPVRNSFRD